MEWEIAGEMAVGVECPGLTAGPVSWKPRGLSVDVGRGKGSNDIDNLFILLYYCIL
jgi:hypothetical protein